jgi:CBS domain-containing protein
MEALLARDLMTTAVKAVAPGVLLTEVERTLSQLRVSGLPVTDEAGMLVGIVSLADIVRALSGAASEGEAMLAYYRDVGGADPSPSELMRLIGERAASLRVQDVMATTVLTVGPDEPVADVARRLAERAIHRVFVAEGKKLLGIVSTLDIARAVADGRLVAAAR